MGSRRRIGRRGGAVPAAVAIAALALGACSDDGPSPEADPTTAAPTAEDRLEQARAALAEAGTARLVLEGADLPEDQDTYVLRAEGSGTMQPPAFEGTITAKIAGLQADVPTIAVDDSLYVQLPFTPSYVETSPDELNVPDPARLFDVEDGVVSLLSRTEGAEFGEVSRDGRAIVQQVTGTLPGRAVVDLLRVGDAEADFAVTYSLLEEDWQVRAVELSGPFYAGAESTYTLTLDQYGEPVTVTSP